MNYLNDNDRQACEWLRELVREGLLDEGVVDERPIQEVTAKDLEGYNQCHFFAGIGGWPYALSLAGWPAARPVWTGSCPCQPFSAAGKGQGEADERHLWPAWFSLIRVCRPDTVFGEQVASRDGYRWFDGVRTDLEAEGYAVGAADLPAASQGAPHIRQRLFWVACRPADLQGDRRRQGSANPARGGEGVESQGSGQRSADHRGGRPAAGSTPNTRGRTGERHAGAVPGAETRVGRARQQHGHLPDRPEHGEPVGLPRDPDEQQPGDAAAADAREAAGRWAAEPGVPVGAGHLPDAGGGSARRVHRPGKGTGASHGIGRGRGQEADHQPPGDCPTGRCWDAFDILPYRDGKSRRVEPGTFPLAHGVPGRVGLLRGYGNAIVPQVAAAFVRAFLEAEKLY